MAITSSLKPTITQSLLPSKLSSSSSSLQFSFPVSVACKPTNIHHSLSSNSLSRRIFLPSVSGIWDAFTGGIGGNNSQKAVQAIRRGMLLFRQGDVMASLSEFDKAIQLDPRHKACRSLAKGALSLLSGQVWGRGRAIPDRCSPESKWYWGVNMVLSLWSSALWGGWS